MSSVALAVDIGGSAVRAALVDQEGEIHARVEAPTSSGPLVDVVAAVVGDVLREAEQRKPRSCAISVPEYVHDGSVTSSMVIPWDQSGGAVVNAIRGQIGTDVSVVIESDVHCGGLAEYALGSTQSETLFYVSWGTGISSTFILPGGKIHRGAHGAAIALGEVASGTNADLTLEQFASGAGMASRWAKAHPTDAVSAQELVGRAGSDPDAHALVAEASEALGRTLRDMVSVLDPDRVAVGGGLGAAENWYWAPLRAAFDRGDGSPQRATLVPATAGPHSSLLGAARVAHAMQLNPSR